jgi:hypothetical protein
MPSRMPSVRSRRRWRRTSPTAGTSRRHATRADARPVGGAAADDVIQGLTLPGAPRERHHPRRVDASSRLESRIRRSSVPARPRLAPRPDRGGLQGARQIGGAGSRGSRALSRWCCQRHHSLLRARVVPQIFIRPGGSKQHRLRGAGPGQQPAPPLLARAGGFASCRIESPDRKLAPR